MGIAFFIMFRLIVFISFLLPKIGFSQEPEKVDTSIVRVSFYFQESTNSLAPESRVSVLDIINEKRKGRLQIIEMNTFCSEFGSAEKNIRTAQERIGILLEELEMSKTPSSTMYIENFGNEKPRLNFEPKNWNRIDVYYTFHNFQKYNANYVATKSDTFRFKLNNEVETTMEKPEIVEEVEKKKEVKLNIPNLIPIQFRPNKAKLIMSSAIHLDELYETLVDNPNISAHIRGHVCCAPNFKMSKKRAKVVYKYLLKKGVSEERISFRGYSNEIPVVFPERTERDRERNRRVDVVFKEIK